MGARIGVVGGLNMDIHLFDLKESGGQAPLVADRYLVEPGGKGANQARGAARLGASVVLVGRVGDDEFGAQLVDACRDDGVDVAGVVRGTGRSGFVVIELRGGRHRSIVYAPGANAALTWAEIEPSLPSLAACDLVVAQAEVPPPVLASLVRWSRAVGTPLYLDPSPPEDVTHDALLHAEALTPDLEEGAALAGRTAVGHAAPLLMAHDLVRAGARRVLLKLDDRGTLLAEPGRAWMVPTAQVQPVDEIGAGDAFLAALAVRRAEGAPWIEATRFANAASALSVSRPGLVLPERAEVELLLRTVPENAESLDGLFD